MKAISYCKSDKNPHSSYMLLQAFFLVNKHNAGLGAFRLIWLASTSSFDLRLACSQQLRQVIKGEINQGHHCI